MLQQFTKRQLKEVKYQQDQKAMQELAKNDPDAIIVYLPKKKQLLAVAMVMILIMAFKLHSSLLIGD